MKATEAKASTPAAQKAPPFFSKGKNQGLGAPDVERKAFFNTPSVQCKVAIGEPNDRYEQEADAVADKVVQRKKYNGPAVASTISPLVQTKCAHCEQEEKAVQRQGESAAPATSSPSLESNLSASKGNGTPLPAATQSEMETSFGTGFSNVRIHNDTGAVQMSKDLNAHAFTHGRDIYFNSGKFDTQSQEGKHLLAHELTHVVQQRSDNAIQRMPSLDDIKQGAEDIYDGAKEGLKEAGEAVSDAAEAVADAPGKVVDWISSAAGEAALTLANMLIARYGGSIKKADGGGIEISIPDVPLSGRHQTVFPWHGATKEKIIAQTEVDVPYVGPVFLTLFGRGLASASVSAGIGPAALQGINLTINPGKSTYSGSATLSAPADLAGNLTLSGILGVSANPLCVKEVLRVEGGLSISGTAGLETELRDTVSVTYTDGDFDFDNKLILNNCLVFDFDLNALANISIMGHSLLSGKWNLVNLPYEKCWPIVLMGEVYTGGGGSSGGGGAGGSYDDEPATPQPKSAEPPVASNAAAAPTPGAATPDAPPGKNMPQFTADSLMDTLFGGTAPEFTKNPIALDPGEKKVLSEECPVEPADPCQDAPTGLTPDDAIPMVWLKNPGSSLYPNPITLSYQGRQFTYTLFERKVTPDGLDTIGIEPQYFPFVGKPLTKSLFPRGYDPELTRFKSVLRRFGYSISGGGSDADHFQDDLWNGPGVFGNFWPFDFRANRSAGARQNRLQEVKWAEYPGGPVYLSCIADPDLRSRYFRIVAVLNPETGDVKTRACNNREQIC